MPLVDRRYAEALVNISVQNQSIDSYQRELEEITELYEKQPELKFFLLNPEFKNEVKKAVIMKLFDGRLSTEIVNLIMLLLDKGRIKALPGILREYTRLADKRKNYLNMTIISASPLEEVQIESIKEKYRKLYNASQVKTDIQIDTDIVGGIRIKIGDKVIDGSIKGRLESLRELLVK